ncbi:CidA/LrgA family holin-like protein [Sporosarcina sp. Marseille-Q4063]|uniref:CidA/LrgA family protein n=1 Tax=Sporosarcina sp. Marseille-Q4063 TaxID=2810514 RepID=UPI001BB08769|nr:CidA/LrgA family holin-like protein [Sporosarcina sp. Marseille-Q4063]QUW22446.1 CidA/LrgA family holin-like protein [Sporosarcina sp. Marseille-Q4063]
MKKCSVRRSAIIAVQIIGLFIFSYIGDLISSLLKLPIPGSIVGLLLLFLCLHFKIVPERYIKEGAGFILVVLPLFFIPATVGIIQYPDFLSGKGAILIGIVMISTFMTMIVSGFSSQLVENKMKEKEE